MCVYCVPDDYPRDGRRMLTSAAEVNTCSDVCTVQINRSIHVLSSMSGRPTLWATPPSAPFRKAERRHRRRRTSTVWAPAPHLRPRSDKPLPRQREVPTPSNRPALLPTPPSVRLPPRHRSRLSRFARSAPVLFGDTLPFMFVPLLF